MGCSPHHDGSSVEEREIEWSWEEMSSTCSEEAHLPKRAGWRKTERTSAISSRSCPCWDILTLKSERKKRGNKLPGSVTWHWWADSINVQSSRSLGFELWVSSGKFLQTPCFPRLWTKVPIGLSWTLTFAPIRKPRILITELSTVEESNRVAFGGVSHSNTN